MSTKKTKFAVKSIEDIDNALKEYYQSLNKKYDNKFSTYCDENGFDDEDAKDELNGEAQGAFLLFIYIHIINHVLVLCVWCKYTDSAFVDFDPGLNKFNLCNHLILLN